MSLDAGSGNTDQTSTSNLPDDAEVPHSRWRKRMTVIGAVVVLVGAAVVLPPLVNIGRYQRQVTALMSRALGRPVRMSSVGLRLLPRPGFVLNDLTVSEDPKFGAEPVLFARTVAASVGIVPLWKGRLEVTRISVDEASLNLVQTAEGHWNLESLMMQAQPGLTGGTGSAGKPGGAHFPYLEATNSRVNLMRGAEKSPYSLVESDLSLWQDQPGEWRVRLRGQPVRTDLEIVGADTGEVRLEGSLHAAQQLRDMPIKLQAEWREAQLGQLSRLLLGSDAGWRGDVTADIQVEGTAESAQTKARLRATGVRREEFTPETPLDLDANCSFRYQHSRGAVHTLGCDTAIGSGLLHLKGELPGLGAEPEAMLEVRHAPLQAALDLLRTVRNGFAPGISAKGEVNGILTYAGSTAAPVALPAASKRKSAKPSVPVSRLKGALVVEGGSLTGGGLKEPLFLPTITWAPVPPIEAIHGSAGAASQKGSASAVAGATAGVRLEARFTVPLASDASPSRAARAGAPSAEQPAVEAAQDGVKPVEEDTGEAEKTPETEQGANRGLKKSPAGTHDHTPDPTKSQGSDSSASAEQVPVRAKVATVRLDVGAQGYHAEASGSTSVAKMRELAYAFGIPHLETVDGLSGNSADFELAAAGPWIVSAEAFSQSSEVAEDGPAEGTAVADRATLTDIQRAQSTDVFSGAVQLRHAQWTAPYLRRSVELTQSMVTVTADAIHVNSEFTYGTPKDLLNGSVAVRLVPKCKGSHCTPTVQLWFGALDASVIQAAMLANPEQKSLLAPIMDRVRGTEKVKWPTMPIAISADTLTLGPVQLQKPVAQMHMEGDELVLDNWEASALGGNAHGTGRCSWDGSKPVYEFDGEFAHLAPGAVAPHLGTHWKDGVLKGSGKVKLSGLNQKELAAGASGDVQFQWSKGMLTPIGQQSVRFDDWSGSASLLGGKFELGKNTLTSGKRTASVTGSLTFGGPPRLTVNDAAAPGVSSQSKSSPSR